MPAVSLHHIHKKYGDVQALAGVDLSIGDGEFCVIIGPSGSGKTTLLNIIAGFTRPDSGEVAVDGRMVNQLSPRERNIGMVFQDIGLFSHLTARDNISFGLEIKKKHKREIHERVNEIADRLKIRKLLDKKPGLLSGGEAQRVAIGRTLVSDPSFFLFDEPLGNLDADLKMEMLTEIKRLYLKLKKTFIYVTHDQEQALSVASHVVIMRDGMVLQEGNPREIYNNPMSRFVAEFFGMQAMNMIDGTLKQEGRGSMFEGEGLKLALPGRCSAAELPVTLGIRPADVGIAADTNSGDGIGSVQAVKFQDDKNHVQVALPGGTTVTAIAPPDVKPGLETTVGATLNRKGIYLFDKDRGGRIVLG
jgi:multiple sugar transport system ATP-binding protein